MILCKIKHLFKKQEIGETNNEVFIHASGTLKPFLIYFEKIRYSEAPK